MAAVNPLTSPRQSGAVRREAILDAACEEIAVSGFAGATTADIARRAGISQPYVFRFFPSKKDLSLAVVDRCVGQLLADWERVLPGPGETRLDALGRSYVEALPNRRTQLLVQLQAYAAAGDPGMAEAMRHHLARIFRYIVLQARRDGAAHPHADAATFLSRGFLINAAMAIGLESTLTPEEWEGICSKNEIARVSDRTEQAAS
jgi:AcrR family transcriptional regulator